jgi:hypothetical protein
MSATLHKFPVRERPCDSELPPGIGAVTPSGQYGPRLSFWEVIGVVVGACLTFGMLCALLIP